MNLLTSDDNLSKNHSGIKSLGGGMGGPSGPQSISECARDEISVYGINEEDYYGKVQQAGSWFKPIYDIFNSSGELQFKVRGPICNFSFCCCCSRKCRGVRFKVLDPKTDQPVGVFFKDVDDFVLEFPESIDVRMKTVLLSALILIDIIYFDAIDGRNSVVQNLAIAAGVATVWFIMSAV